MVRLMPGFIAPFGTNFTAKIAPCTVGEVIIEGRSNLVAPTLAAFKLFPNPASSLLTLNYELGEDADVAIHLYNSKGQLVEIIKSVIQEKQGNYSMEFPVAHLSTGLYLVVVHANQTIQTQTLSVIK
ncbi:MAG: T9SS type A sorting domain-containing protein [Saprospiraceae bacterium]|nr:T9SS type A sorting domain-containing protein [Saprospiraceae bacterium]